jgi:hypothetical protein
MDDFSPDALARAVHKAREATPAQLAAARTHATAFTWSRTAERIRETLLEAIERRQQGVHAAGGAPAAVDDRG